MARMQTFIFLLPVLTVLVLLASGKASLAMAGFIALLLSAPAAWVALGDGANLATWIGLLASGSGRGMWIAWQAVSVIIGGLLFYKVLSSARPELFAPRETTSDAISHRWLFTICFLLGPFVEAATGFGVGYLITISALMRMGLGRFESAVFGLFSQMLVPWGALGVGTLIGAELADISIAELGVHSALISTALMFGYLVVFWWMLWRVHARPTILECADDALWLLALCAALVAANQLVAVEVAGLLCAAPLLVLRYLRDREPGAMRFADMALTVQPYVALTLLLVVTRSVPAIDDWLRGLIVLQPAPDLPRFSLFHHPSFWLLFVALGYGMLQLPKQRWAQVGRDVLSSGRIPVLVTVVFMMMAETLSLAGIPAALAQSWVSVSGHAAVAISPLLSVVAGALTGSNTASNGMLMVLQVELATRADAAPVWIAAVQKCCRFKRRSHLANPHRDGLCAGRHGRSRN